MNLAPYRIDSSLRLFVSSLNDGRRPSNAAALRSLDTLVFADCAEFTAVTIHKFGRVRGVSVLQQTYTDGVLVDSTEHVQN